MAWTVYKYNDYDFSEATDRTGLGDNQPLVTNGQGRAFTPMEIVLNSAAPFYCGEVREAGGIADGASGRISIEHRGKIRTSQIDKDAAAIAVGDEIFFQPGGAGAPGELRPAATKAAGSIKFGRVEGVGGTSGAYEWLEVRPYAFDSERALEV
jgi:hypothetical protein